MEGRSSNNEKKGRYKIMKTQKIFEIFIVKWAVKVRILGNASFMAFYLIGNSYFSTFSV